MLKNTLDLKLISGEFLYDELPPDKEYLRKYFSGEIQNRFLVYYINFKDLTKTHCVRHFCHFFVDHTGVFSPEQWIYRLVKKVIHLEGVVAEAECNLDLEMLSEVKLGMYKGWHD